MKIKDLKAGRPGQVYVTNGGRKQVVVLDTDDRWKRSQGLTTDQSRWYIQGAGKGIAVAISVSGRGQKTNWIPGVLLPQQIVETVERYEARIEDAALIDAGIRAYRASQLDRAKAANAEQQRRVIGALDHAGLSARVRAGSEGVAVVLTLAEADAFAEFLTAGADRMRSFPR